MYNRITTNKILTHKITLPTNVTIEKINDLCIFIGPQGKITHVLKSGIITRVADDSIIIEIHIEQKDKKQKKLALLNTIVAIFKNYIKGVTELFEKTVIIKGIGYKVEHINTTLKLFLGYSHPIIYVIPDDIIIDLPNATSICIKGISKHKVGQIAHEIKMKKPADIYKGNGIRYKDETLKLKSSKKTK